MLGSGVRGFPKKIIYKNMSRQGSNPSLYLTSEVLIPLYYKMLLDLRFNFLFKEKKTIKI